MTYTVQEAIQGVYLLLRRPSDVELAYEDALKRYNDNLKGYFQDEVLAGRDRLTASEEIDLEEADTDFIIRLPEVPDFEAIRLEYADACASTPDWQKIELVPFAAWQPDPQRVVGSVYGSRALRDGQKVRLNLSPQAVANRVWRLSYRLPLLAYLQAGSSPLLPELFMPMPEVDTALDCMDIVNNDSEGWVKWVARTTPKYVKRSEEWRERWQTHLEKSVEDPIQTIQPFDQFRRGVRTSQRAYLPRQ